MSSIDALVARLPEVYQPIFGHDEHAGAASRAAEDRLQPILAVYRDLEAQLKRPLRVLDLGCAQGFFCLQLANLGATTHGVDFQHSNIAVCEALARENPAFAASFRVARIENILAELKPDQYDLVLGLSVFHHLIRQIGGVRVQAALSDLAAKVLVGIFEMARAEEPAEWAASLPKNPRQVLAGFGFVLEIAEHKTHLSAVRRPLYYASNRYWRVAGCMVAFEYWTPQSHPYDTGSHYGTRRYFFADGVITKLYMLDCPKSGAANLIDHLNEIAFLQSLSTDFKVPELIAHGRSECEAWLMRQAWPGRLLLDIINSGNSYDAHRVVRDILNQLVGLEGKGLYHNDLRTWNVLIGPDGGASIIDFGAISSNGKDCGWPHNIFLSFVVLVNEILTGRVENLYPLRTLKLNPGELPNPYRRAIADFYAAPTETWRFSELRDNLLKSNEPPDGDTDDGGPTGNFAALRAMEEACGVYHTVNRQWRDRALRAEAQLASKPAIAGT